MRERIDVHKLDVFIGNQLIGTLAEAENGLTAFEYSDEWLISGFSLNPFSLPLEKKVFLPKYMPFYGIFGVFADTLPDGWGRLLVDRYLRSELDLEPEEVSELFRLTMVADSGMGALSYVPAHYFEPYPMNGDYDKIAEDCRRLLEEDFTENLDALFRMGGSSGGARPKILTKIDGEDWIIKFPSSYDSKDIGVCEYEYSLCAKECGIEMSETRLFESQECGGYFGTKRFDRAKTGSYIKKIHMVSVSGLLETSHRLPSLDYNQLLRLAFLLTEDMKEVENMYNLMCFNVFAHNRDDHAKNFAFLYDEERQRWRLSPAFDLTYSNSIRGEHATTIDGEGKTPGMEDILSAAEKSGLNMRKAKSRAEEIQEIVNHNLSSYL